MMPLARTHDPQTSHAAAAQSGAFRARHEAKIWQALKDHGPMNKDGIATHTGLDSVAVARRGKGMERRGLVVIGPDTHDGSRIWRAI